MNNNYKIKKIKALEIVQKIKTIKILIWIKFYLIMKKIFKDNKIKDRKKSNKQIFSRQEMLFNKMISSNSNNIQYLNQKTNKKSWKNLKVRIIFSINNNRTNTCKIQMKILINFYHPNMLDTKIN